MLHRLLVLLCLAVATAGAQTPTDFVDPFIGTDGTGHTFPGASMPFGMVQPGPDNRSTGWAYTAGYQYRDPQILGFSQTHISGAGVPELGDVLLLPLTDATRDAAVLALRSGGDAAATYDKASESARPGRYAVTLGGGDVRVELTASPRVAMHRYTFPAGGRVWVLVDLQHGLTFGERERVTGAVSGVTDDGAEASVWSANWVEREMHAAVVFDHPVTSSVELLRRPGERARRYLLSFDLAGGTVLQAKAAVSTVGISGARGNLQEVPHWDWDRVAADADAAWNALLGRVTIEADRRTQRIFTTALYHALLHPSDIADRDGRVRGPDGAVLRAPGGVYYSTLSLWDTFRAAHPLYTLVVPERVPGFARTMLAHHDAQGYLPLWTAWGRETHTMIGNPALPVLADAVAKGFDVDLDRALAAAVQTSTVPHRNSEWDVYLEHGYFPTDRVPGEAVSKTLEAGIGDAAVARLARAAGADSVAAAFEQRAGFYRALFDPETRTMRGRDAAGAWRTPFDPLEATSPLANPGDYTEANAWQYLWTPALHDARGFRDLLGGPAALGRTLDAFFALDNPDAPDATFLGQEALIGQYAHGNEPSHHVAWLYALSDRPETGRARVREIARRFYADTPDGILGNDDCGQMSAWYVLATLGLYPLDPADGRYVVGEPLVDAARLRVPGGADLRIVAAPSARTRVQLDGEPVGVFVDHRSLVGASELRVALDP